MENIIRILNLLFLFSGDLFFLILLYASISEREIRAVIGSSSAIIINSFLWIFFWCCLESQIIQTINVMFLLGGFSFLILSMIRFFPKIKDQDLSSIEQFDERDHMFARNNLQFNNSLAFRYYKDNPEKRDVDSKIHKEKELGEEGSVYYDFYNSGVFESAFKYLKRTKYDLREKSKGNKEKIDKIKFSLMIEKIARYYGAVDVGITSLKHYHLYSHAGRHTETWGKLIDNSHSTAIVIVVAMKLAMMKKAPTMSAVIESSRQYVEAAKIANIIAEYIHGFGYDARAHTDQNYETLCVPLAVDSGVGVLGRMGIVIHDKYGPCVRLSVVTTELELRSTEKKKMFVNEFCDLCKKCAENCPAQAVSYDQVPESRGFKHWTIESEQCYSFWKRIGTDCGFCIRVCPYTKPNTFIHNFIRTYISRNSFNQRLALFFDNLFYGKKPKIHSRNPKDIIV